MGYQERRVELIAKRAAPHLEPGEKVQTGFIALTGWLIFTVPECTVVATDRAILAIGRDGTRRFPRETRFGRPTGLYHKIYLGRGYKVHRQYYREIAAADDVLREMRAPDGQPRPVEE
ncbi:hypothetical protein [Amycolatopsis silviterrae]|uniref:Uncharacterized protein n=1 Tax=Amycolatopsis silviterrae TaxID=1656914 RepID=A0ABW5HGK8_9PSEU